MAEFKGFLGIDAVGLDRILRICKDSWTHKTSDDAVGFHFPSLFMFIVGFHVPF